MRWSSRSDPLASRMLLPESRAFRLSEDLGWKLLGPVGLLAGYFSNPKLLAFVWVPAGRFSPLFESTGALFCEGRDSEQLRLIDGSEGLDTSFSGSYCDAGFG